MTIRVAITGYGRIGRNVLRAFYEEALWKDMKIVAINDVAKPEVTVHLTKYDTAHGENSMPMSPMMQIWDTLW